MQSESKASKESTAAQKPDTTAGQGPEASVVGTQSQKPEASVVGTEPQEPKASVVGTEPQEPKASLVGREYEVEVGPVAHGGHCIARTSEGQVLIVRHALPGEKVVARVTDGEEGARFLRADAVTVLDPSKDRVEAPCPFSGPGKCGGCDWQHAKPGAQRRLKGEVIAEQLMRLAGLTPEEAGWDGTVMPAEGDKLPAGQVPQWRTRVQYAIDAEGVVGLRKHRSHDIQPIDHCMIASQGVSELGIEKREWPQMASVEAIAATGSNDRQVILTPAPGGRLPLVELDKPVSVLRVHEKDGGVHKVHGRAFVRERADGRTYRVGMGGFWQVHPQAADTLMRAVMQGLMPRKGETALDLYCGVGLFAGSVAERVGERGAVLGIESGKRAVEDARHNLESMPNVRIEQGKVDQVLPRTGITETDLIVLDPPRAGAGKQTVKHLATLGARRIAYVACDPAALARDIAYFKEGGYKVRTLRAFDLFPMTHHVECVAILEPIAKAA